MLNSIKIIKKASPIWVARMFSAILITVFFLASPAYAASTQVWFVDQKTINQLDTETFSVVQSAALSDQAIAIAVDSRDKNLWVLTNSTIYKHDSSFGLLFSFDLTELSRSKTGSNAAFPSAERLAINPYDGSVWIAAQKHLLHVSETGAIMHAWEADNVIDDIDLGIDEYLWVLTNKAVIKINKFGIPATKLALDVAKQNPRFQEVDNLRAALWLADKGQLQRYSLADTASSPYDIAISGSGTVQPAGLAGDFSSGDVWLTDKDTLYQYSASGILLKQIDLGVSGIKNPQHLLWDPVGKALWVGDDTHLAVFNSASELLHILPTKKLRAIATDNLVLQPVLQLTAPAHNSFINTKRPDLVFQMAGACNLAPCLDSTLYADRFILNAFLDSLLIGPNITKGAGVGVYAPTVDLAEGAHTVTGYAIDPFGHTSSPIDSLFVVDTVAPEFQNVQPASNSTLSESNIEISGKVVDASPVGVHLKDKDDNIIGSAGAEFRFPATLADGANNFKLVASDAAGNATTHPLSYTLGNPLELEIILPAAGATVPAGKLFVVGRYTAPPNSGVTVNDELALAAGEKFVAEIYVQEGQQELVAKLATFGGATKEVRQPIAVVASAPEESVHQFGLEIITEPAQKALFIDTFAGNGTSEYSGDGGPAKAAGIVPFGLEVIADGTLYFVEGSASRVRKVDPDGIVHTVAGPSPAAGYSSPGFAGDGGPATSAKLAYPSDVAEGPDGSLYIADQYNHRIRKITPDGIIRTIAGNGTATSSGDGGQAAGASLFYPDRIVIGSDGTIYFTEPRVNRVRRIGPDGIITTVAGTGIAGFSGDGGPGSQARLRYPADIDLDADGVLYIADQENNRIRKLDGNGIISSVAEMSYPDRVVVDRDGTKIVSLKYACHIVRVNPDDTQTKLSGQWCSSSAGDGGPASEGKFGSILGMAIDQYGTLYFSDINNYRIRKLYTPDASSIQQANIKLSFVSGTGPYVYPHVDLDFDSDGVPDSTVQIVSQTRFVKHFYTEPGAHLVTATFRLPDGSQHIEQSVVLVEDENAKDQVIRELWAGMNQALRNKDLNGALKYLNGSAVKQYKGVFEALMPYMNEIIDSYSPLYKVELSTGYGEYAINRQINNEKKLFFVYFLKSGNGVWRLDSM